jgi:hypothetical protein
MYMPKTILKSSDFEMWKSVAVQHYNIAATSAVFTTAHT